jgi:hypothetical protein
MWHARLYSIYDKRYDFRKKVIEHETRVLFSATYSESVFVAFGIQHAIRMPHIVICGLPGCTVCFHKRHDLKKKLLNMKRAFLFSATFV